MHQPSAFRSSGSQTTLPGAWLLEPGAAMTLRPGRPGLLRVTGGGLWATFDGPHPGPANDQGDQLLAAGAALEVHAGQRLVIESLYPALPAHFTWDPLPAGPAGH